MYGYVVLKGLVSHVLNVNVITNISHWIFILLCHRLQGLMGIPNHLRVVELFWNIMVPSILAIVIAQLGKFYIVLFIPPVCDSLHSTHAA